MNQADAPSSAKVADDNRGNTWVEPAENITENDAGNSAQENIGNTIESLPPEIEEDTPADNIGNVVGANDGKEGGNEKSTQRRNNNRRRGPRSRNLRRRNNSPQQEG